MPPLPAGYILLDNKLLKKYTLKYGDKIYYLHSNGWVIIVGWAGYNYAKILKMDMIKILYIAIKGEGKPRFKTDKPYPFGY